MSPQVRVRLDTFRHTNRTLEATLELIRTSIVKQTQERLLAEPELEVPYLVVHLTNTFWSFHSLECAKVHTAVMTS